MKKIILATLMILLGSCSQQKAPNTLRIAFNSYPTTLDPRKTGDFVSSTLICLLYDGLSRCLEDGSSELSTAEKVDISEDQLIYTFHLRDTYWTDGKPVTAYDFEQSWKKILDPKFPAVCAYLFYPIKNSEAAAKGEVPLDQVGVKALDEKTLQVELERPTPYFLGLTAFPSFLPVPSHLSQSDIDLQKKETFVCNGPFQIGSYQANSGICLSRNEQYWNRGKIYLDGVQISIVLSEGTALQMFERKELDWLGGPFSPIPADAKESIRNKEELKFYPMAATTFCSFNTAVFPLNNSSIRRAFALAVDRKEIVEKITLMGQRPATRCIPPSLMNYQDRSLYPPISAKEEARQALEKGMKELQIQKMPLLTLTYRSSQADRLIAQTLQKQWREVLGIEIALQQSDFKIQKERLHRRNYEMGLTCWIAQFSDPINILERFKDPSNPKNYPGWNSPRFISLIEKALQTADPDERLGYIASAEAVMGEESPICPIFHWTNASLSQPRLQNLQTTPSGGVLFERCWLKDL